MVCLKHGEQALKTMVMMMMNILSLCWRLWPWWHGKGWFGAMKQEIAPLYIFKSTPNLTSEKSPNLKTLTCQYPVTVISFALFNYSFLLLFWALSLSSMETRLAFFSFWSQYFFFNIFRLVRGACAAARAAWCPPQAEEEEETRVQFRSCST